MRLNGTHEIKHTGQLSLELFADKDRLDQVFVNLVNNTVKYAHGSNLITIDVKDLGDKVKVSVIDKGIGISAEFMPYLFDRYYRVEENGNKSSVLGLGLYISDEIVRKHGGEIGVDTDFGKGATFWFILSKAL